MRTILTFIAAAALLMPASAAAQTTPAQPASNDLILAVDARRTTASGTSSAGDHGTTSFESYTYASAGDLCGLGTGDDEPVRMPWVGWHYKADILGSSAGAAGPELNVRITWERRWNNGARTTDGPAGTNTVTMRAGDVLVLDRVTPSTPGRCGEELRLEATVMTAASRYRGMRGAGVGGRGLAGGVAGGGGRGGAAVAGRAGGAAAGVGGAATAAGGARGGTAVAGRGRGSAGGGGAAVAGGGTGSTTVAGRGGRGGAAGTDATASGQATTAGGRGGGRGSAGDAIQRDREALSERIALMTGRRMAEIWLIHRTPDGVEHVQQQTVTFTRATREFSFPPVAVNTSRGVVMVDINGTLRVTDNQIAIGLGRRARASGAQPLDTTGSSEMSVDLPRPEEVLSFEFPALQKPAEDLLAKHKFSVRVRVK
jgi:hypothetical protein